MSYDSSCKSCSHKWNTPTEDGPATMCPNCKATSTVFIGSAFVEDVEDDDDSESDSKSESATTQFEPTSKASVEKVKKPPELDISDYRN